ncbi:Type I restriction-modification system, specificity subunit S [Methanosarcina horonobensis HB-1 = JCM 15518]|uniref:Type I restriction-modification system, specificity subunit S n=1 Tax=Methanosarcina horonobensis HB-1 = JCM 15518 TaxID=1434110 RepID=A0A0E3SC32_9EURY|nr:hypothetical protein [Methanosarcina horonobensis]AKB77452.1 Type I restriction-modification system, specificity subunit S [Methanosarcina horonobensis HB-1 = JCM 15518]
MGEIPEGWGVKSISELADFVKGFSYKGSEKFTEPPSKVFVTLNNVYEGGGFKPEYAWIQSDRTKERHLVREGDLIILNTEQTKDRRLLGFPAIVYFPHNYRDETGVFSHHITKVTPFDDRYKNYLHFHLYFTQIETLSFYRIILAQSFGDWM